VPTPFVVAAVLMVQSPASPARSARDSQTILRAARRAQGEFELTRRWHLPSAPPVERCDERVGRFCYWHGDDPAERPAEPERIRRARDALLATLDSLATLLPGDGWVAGQRVRYLVEGGRTRDAVLAAEACRAALWWCWALGGLARHAAAEFPAADSVFDAALGLMPPDERCRWSDLSPLVEGDLAKRYRALACEERAGLEARLWWLARPLWSQPGNDRRSAHFARLTMVHLMRDARTAYGLAWGRDLADITVRYGWPLWWTQVPPRATGTVADAAVTGHEATPGFHFLPPTRAALDPAAAREEDFTLRAARPRERYAPSYAKAFTAPAHQSAVFRRGDTALVVAAYDLTADTPFARAPLAAALVLARDERTRPVVARRDHAPPRGVLLAAGAWAPLLLSLEVTTPERHHVARARYGWRPPAPERRVSSSDLLLFAADDSLPTTLEQVAPHALGSRAVPSDRQLGLYWELYGLGSGGSGRGVVTTAVSVLPLKRGFLGLGRRKRVRLEWQDHPERVDGIGARTLRLDLSGLAPGRYRVVLSVKPEDEPPVTASREIVVSWP
jgi:hypothetical protein